MAHNPSPLIGLVVVPLFLVAVSLLLVRGGVGFTSPLIPLAVLQFPPSPTHSEPWLRWIQAPRDILIGMDIERMVLAYAASGVVIAILNALSPNWNRGPKPDPKAQANLDPRKAKSAHLRPADLILGALAFHIVAMRVLALRSAPGYAEVVDARAAMKKQTGPPFQDVAGIVGGVLGLLLGFRELGHFGDRLAELICK